MSQSNLRSKLVRLAASLPSGSESRRSILGLLQEKSAASIPQELKLAIEADMLHPTEWGAESYWEAELNGTLTHMGDSEFTLRSLEATAGGKMLGVAGTWTLPISFKSRRGDILIKGELTAPFATELDPDTGHYDEVFEIARKVGFLK
jgi:hypothetical protein